MVVRGKHLINAFLLHDDNACTISQAPFLIETATVELPSLREQRSVSGVNPKISQCPQTIDQLNPFFTSSRCA